MSPGSDYFQTINYSDGGVAVAALTDEHYEVLLPMLGYPELVGTPIFASIASRMTNMKEVMRTHKEPKKDIGVEKAIEILTAADIPCSPCTKRDNIETVEQIKAISALETYVTKAMGKLTVTTPPIQFDGKLTSHPEPSPLLGEHSKEILQELGWENSEITKLIDTGNVYLSKV